MIGQIAANYPSSLFNQVPRGLFNYGAGGVNAWRNICGGPNGGSALLAQLGAPTSVKDEFNAWYERTLFPSNAAFVDWNAGGWTVTTAPRTGAPQAEPQSLLCHASHGRWLDAAGGEEGGWVASFPGADAAAKVGAAGADRCSKLVYDCVYKLCELINNWKAGTMPTGALDPSVAACFGCHGSVDPLDPENCAPEVAGKMRCTDTCHK
ncbi:MAG: hypothetical protein Q7W51_05665 [Coriobacteriia bacterium]|nr:hypothetical protein [Coriobacteriia bacterium]